MSVDAAPDRTDDDSATDPAFDRVVDWILGALLALGGILFALGGAALYYGITRAGVAEAVREGEFQSDVLTEAEAVDALVAFANWSGIGLVVAGLLVAALGVAVVVVHGRARREGRGTPAWVLGVAGATVETVLGFVPFSPVLGGAVAGYLEPDRESNGLAVGALAGVIGSLPLFVVAVFASVGLVTSAAAPVATAVAAILVIAVVVSLVYFVGLSALGGYLGQWARDR